MIQRKFLMPSTQAALLVVGTGLSVWFLTASPAGAIVDGKQLLSGGTSMTAGSTLWTAPGLSNVFGNDFPGPGKGENAAQIRIPAVSVLSSLRVKVTTQNKPTSGTLSVMVRKNNADTTLTCQLANTGNCNGNTTVSLAANDRLAVRIVNNFVGAGFMTFTYTLLLD